MNLDKSTPTSNGSPILFNCSQIQFKVFIERWWSRYVGGYRNSALRNYLEDPAYLCKWNSQSQEKHPSLKALQALLLKPLLSSHRFFHLSAADNWFAPWLSSLAAGSELGLIFHSLFATKSLTGYYTWFILIPVVLEKTAGQQFASLHEECLKTGLIHEVPQTCLWRFTVVPVIFEVKVVEVGRLDSFFCDIENVSPWMRKVSPVLEMS